MIQIAFVFYVQYQLSTDILLFGEDVNWWLTWNYSEKPSIGLGFIIANCFLML